MKTRTYTQRAKRTFVTIPVPAKIRTQLLNQVRVSGKPFRHVCQSIIDEFIRSVGKSHKAGRLHDITFVATFKSATAAKLMLWIDRDVSTRLKELAEAAHVSRRSVCYTAIVQASQSNRRRSR